jgi:hypothetical protein
MLSFKRHKVRPATGANNPEITVEKYCIYDEPHKDYLYSQAWVDLLIEEQRHLLPVATASPIEQQPDLVATSD